jgi:hypothetical protein
MNDTDIYADRHRAPDPPPEAAADTGSKHATPRVERVKTTLHNRAEHA